MMLIKRSEDLEAQLQVGIQAQSIVDSDHVRTPGTHLSTVISDIAVQMNLLRRYSNTPTLDESGTIGYMGMGFAWEDVIGKALAQTQGVTGIGQFECMLDGIIGTPDHFDPVIGIISEYKATWLSAKHDIMGDKYWRWWAQIKGYSHMVGVDNANLYVFHVNGDYNPPQPMLRVYSAQFLYADLYPNWQLITNHRDKMMREGKLQS